LPMADHSMTKGRVVLVPFPFDDLSSTKVRPAVCLTDPIGSHRHVVLAFISSQVPMQTFESDVIIETSRSDFSSTGLRVSSVLRLHRLMTVTTSFIQRDLGELSRDLRGEVDGRLKKLFEL
jgi:mRNA interferase MazF